jgi:membrane protein
MSGLGRVLEQMRKRLSAGWRFVRYDLWDVDLSSFSKVRGVFVRLLRVVTLMLKGFREDECPLHAASLTFSTLMAIVPVLAISLSLARGFGGAEAAREMVTTQVHRWTETFSEQAATEAVEHVAGGTNEVAAAQMTAKTLASGINDAVEEGFDRVEEINFKGLGGVGVVLLLWMVIQVLGRVESSFNCVWGVPHGRSVWRRFTDYLSVLVVFPLLVTAAASLPAMDMVARVAGRLQGGDMVVSFVTSSFASTFAVLGMSALCFTFLLWFMPNTRVRFWPAFAGGVVAASLFFVLLWGCARLQVGAVKYGNIYGSFALVPIMLLWVSFSWQILLLSAEVSFAVQNCETYQIESGAGDASVLASATLALAILHETAKRMEHGGGFSKEHFPAKRRVSVRLLNHMLDELTAAHYLGRLADEKSETYVLRRVPESIHVREIVEWILSRGVTPADLGMASMPPAIVNAVTQMGALDGSALGNRTLAEMLNEA